MIDLFDLAEQNAAPLRRRFSDRCAELSDPDREVVEAFARHVEQEGRISINMHAWKLRDLVAEGRYLNPHQRAAEKAAETGEDREQLLREDLREWYGKRVTFERRCVEGERFNYGALNIGGLGASDYGEFSVLLDPTTILIDTRLIYVMGNSLTTYVNEGLQLDDVRLGEECAPESAKQCLAALKHAADVATAPVAAWPALLCSGQSFVEVIIGGAPHPDQIVLVRMARNKYNKYRRDVFDGFRQDLTPSRRLEVRDFNTIARLLAERGLEWELLDD